MIKYNFIKSIVLLTVIFIAITPCISAFESFNIDNKVEMNNNFHLGEPFKNYLSEIVVVASLSYIDYTKFFNVSNSSFYPLINMHFNLGGVESFGLFKTYINVLADYDVSVIGFVGYLRDTKIDDNYSVYIHGYALIIKGEYNPMFCL